MNKNLTICPYCEFDNSKEVDMGDTTEINIKKINEYNRKYKANPTMVTIIAIIVIGSVLSVRYFLYDSKANLNNEQPSTTTKLVVNTKEFKYDKLRLYHTLDFESHGNTISLIDNPDINIKIDVLDDETYYEIINNNDMLDTTLNEIDAKTYANDNIYGYLIETTNKKYHITVNYTDSISEEIQGNINKTLKSLTIKE